MNSKKGNPEKNRHKTAYEEQVFDDEVPDARFVIFPSVSSCRRRRDMRPARKRARWQVRTTNRRSRFSH